MDKISRLTKRERTTLRLLVATMASGPPRDWLSCPRGMVEKFDRLGLVERFTGPGAELGRYAPVRVTDTGIERSRQP